MALSLEHKKKISEALQKHWAEQALKSKGKKKYSAKEYRARLYSLEIRAVALVGKAKTEEQRQRFLKQLDLLRKKQGKKVYFAEEITVPTLDIFKKEQPKRRDLTVHERRVDFELLEETFEEAKIGLKKDLTDLIASELSLTLERMKKRLQSADVSSLYDFSLISKAKVSKVLLKYMKLAYEAGKKTASDELSIERPATSLLDTRLMSLHADIIAERFTTKVDTKAKEVAIDGLAKDEKVGSPDPIKFAEIMPDISIAVGDEIDDGIVGITVVLTGEYINKGRRGVFDKFETKIGYYQRTEILDSRTCPFCEEMDMRIFNENDPITKQDLFHDSCRGIWVPVFKDEEFDTDMIGVPKAIAKEAVDKYELPKPTTRFKQGDGPGAQRKLPVAELRPDSEIKRGVPLKDIDYNNIFGGRQAQEAIDDVKAGKLAKTQGPILVIKDLKGGYILIDGAHRLEQARLQGLKVIDVRVGGPEDVRLLGSDAFNKLMRPGLTAPELKTYNTLDSGQQHIYDRLRIEGKFPHEKALKQSKKMLEWQDIVDSKSLTKPLGRELEDRIIHEILERNE